MERELPLPSPSVGFSRDSKTIWLYDFINKALIPFPVEPAADRKGSRAPEAPTAAPVLARAGLSRTGNRTHQRE